MTDTHRPFLGTPITAHEMMRRHRAIGRQIRRRIWLAEHRGDLWLLAFAIVLILAYGSI